MSMIPERNGFQGAASETEPPEATFDLTPAVVQAMTRYPTGLATFCCVLALVAILTAPALVIIAWRAAL